MTAVDDNPCHLELNKIFDDSMVQEKPTDVLVNFIENYCVEEVDEFLPSKCLNLNYNHLRKVKIENLNLTRLSFLSYLFFLFFFIARINLFLRYRIDYNGIYWLPITDKEQRSKNISKNLKLTGVNFYRNHRSLFLLLFWRQSHQQNEIKRTQK